MNYKQLVEPDLSVVGVPEECLAYVREVFEASAEYPTATSGWENAQYKHPGEQPPTDVSVPVWFSYSGPDGHVAVSVPGKGIYSTTKQGDKVFTSIEELINWMNEGFVYLGWSEDVDKERVVEPVPAPTPPAAPQTITLPADSGTWHLYQPGGPYSPNVSADVRGIIYPARFGGLTYPIIAAPGNGVYRIKSEDYGVGDLWTNGSQVVIK